ncbi:replication initiation protein [Clostridium paraputrificum]|jgi:plasmid replication initiation protein|uniref:replication initiation protein n=1 Tax=Clostridium paraputrificum TaxID=29363 RepID=UPI0018A106C1|nr:replication initiation protein [Clostridium paraputrificum]
MDKNYLVTKSNYFIMNCSYDLSLEEQKLILTLASMVQPTDEEFKPYNFKISDFMELLGVETQTKYTEIPKITKELMKKVFEIQEGNTLLQVAWLSSARYEKGSGMVTLKFSPDLKPYMLQLKEKFTQYQLANILSMKSKYSPRIYEILKCNEFKKQKYIDIEIEELRKLIKADTVYPKYNDFKRYIIERTQKELKKTSDISFDFEEIKTGRKVTSLKFYIHQNKAKIINEPTALDEVSVSVSEDIKQDDSLETVKLIIKNRTGQIITDKSANEILKCAIQHNEYGNAPLDLISEVAEHSKTQNIKTGFIGWFKTTVKNFERPIKTVKKTNFNNFEPREYDYDDLEKKLLGWDKEDEE